MRTADCQTLDYETHDQLRAHLQNFVNTYDFALRLKTLRGLTPYEFICKAWTSDPHKIKISPLQQSPGTKHIVACRGDHPNSTPGSARFSTAISAENYTTSVDATG